MRKVLKDNRGFTLIELLASIVIILIIASIITPGVVSLVGRNNDKILSGKYDYIKNASLKYVNDNFNSVRNGNCYINTDELLSNGYVTKDILLLDDGDYLGGYVYRKDGGDYLSTDDDIFEYPVNYDGSGNLCF